MAHDAYVLETDDKLFGLIVRDGNVYRFTASDPETEPLNGTSHATPEEAASVVRLHSGSIGTQQWKWLRLKAAVRG